MKTNDAAILKKPSFLKMVKIKFFTALKLTDQPVVKLYNGYGNKTTCFVSGHTLTFSPLLRKKYRNIFLVNTLALLRLFMVKPRAGATVQLVWNGKIYKTLSKEDGFFRFEWQPEMGVDSGKHNVEVQWLHKKNGRIKATGKAFIFIPHYNQFTFISDIDDTFLISHSTNLRKRLYVLLTENARSRQPFEGVVNHYQLLSQIGNKDNTSTPFFYVSSSEWNLYDYIQEFSTQNKLPKGVYLLSSIKKFNEVFKTGQNHHSTKYTRIVDVIKIYPEQRFILLGDDGQEDPFIYAKVVEDFKDRVFCIYIRMVGKQKPLVLKKLGEIEAGGVPFCYFKHSSEAVIHSKKVGLIIT